MSDVSVSGSFSHSDFPLKLMTGCAGKTRVGRTTLLLVRLMTCANFSCITEARQHFNGSSVG